MRIALGGILHETSTFSPFPTTVAHFEQGFGLFRGAQMIERFRGANTCVGGFLQAADEVPFEPAPLLWGFAFPGGLVQRADYERLKDEFIQRLLQADAERRLDGALIDLHGALVVEGIDDGDGDVVAAVRAALGPQRPIIVTYDLHGNHTPARMAAAHASIGYDTYPHVDMAERGLEAGRLLARTIRGEVRPVTQLAQLPLFWSAACQVTSQPPMREVLERLHAIEQRPGILAASVATGFPWADVPQLGASVFVVADGQPALARQAADELATWIWTERRRWHQPTPDLRATLAACPPDAAGPVILADFNDNTGGGAPGDSTAGLRALVELGVQDSLVLYLVDTEAAAAAHRAGAGARLTLPLGGKSHPAQGEPVVLDVEVMAVSDGRFRYDGPMYAGLTGDLGPCAWLRSGGVSVLVVSKREQPLDAALARSLGIDCTAMRVIIVKSAAHFRSGFERMASQIHVVDAPALHSHRFETMPFRRRRPMFPCEIGAD